MLRDLINTLNSKVAARGWALLLAALYFAISYKFTLSIPYGIHYTRQVDSMAFSLYYLHQNNYNFFDIGNLNLDFENGKASCEFPLLSYLYFLLFKVLGVKLVVVRYVSLLLTCLAIYKAHRILHQAIGNLLAATALVVMVFSSTVLRYYSSNFLPDSVALSLCIIGASYLLRYYFFNEFSNKQYQTALLLFTLAALLKAYYGIYLLAFVALLKWQNNLNIKKSIQATGALLAVIAWYSFSAAYNARHGTAYYLMHPTPVWQMTWDELLATRKFIVGYWYNSYYDIHLLYLLAVLILLALVLNPLKPGFYRLNFLLICAVGAFVALFLKQFQMHDYYFLAMVPAVLVFGAITCFELKHHTQHLPRMYLAYAVLLLAGAKAFLNSEKNLLMRVNNSTDLYAETAYYLNGADQQLDSMGIGKNAKILVIGDKTVNGSLVSLNRFGWIYSDFEVEKQKTLAALNKADYLLVLKPSQLPIPTHIDEYIQPGQSVFINASRLYKLKKHADTNY